MLHPRSGAARVIAAVWWWRPTDSGVGRGTRPERFLLAIGAGLRYARYNPHLRATQIRALGFFLFALRITPAMAAGVTDRIWSVADIVAMIEASEPPPAKRGPYKKQMVGLREENQ